MVNIGFSAPTPVYNTAAFGEPGHFFRLHMRPTKAHPARAMVTFPCGTALFDDADDARAHFDNPGDIGHAAQFYLANLGGES
jgi:hypothetical protein